PADAEVIDGRGKFLIPGLWDMHVHLSWSTSSALPVLIANGVTTVRDMGSTLTEIDGWRTRTSEGTLVGPRIFRVGPILNGKSFNKYQLVPGNADATRGAARVLKWIGVDFIKIHRRFPRDSFFALIDEAKKLQIPVVGHIPMTVTPEEASNAGMSTIEHAETLFEGTFSTAHKNEDLVAAIRHFREDGEAAHLFSVFAKNHTVFDPTLAAWLPETTDRLSADPNMKYVAASNRKLRQAPPAATQQKNRALVAEFVKVVGIAHERGVVLVTGTDSAAWRIPGFSLHDELGLLVKSGLTPLEALRAASIAPATVVGHAKDLGSIDSGRIADLILLDANPLDDIRNTRKIDAVIVNGRVFRRDDLDALLREAEHLAAAQ
ncbi:MAG TPA: amidohydrolase family protein, partial [Thermoanaerobaculia bacterium]|nr:amidohydrolase family protein [Thermoanaerobaculia bacterium]